MLGTTKDTRTSSILGTTPHHPSQVSYCLLTLNCRTGPVFSYKFRYIVGFWLVELAISTNQKPTIYRNLYENTCPGVNTYSMNTAWPVYMPWPRCFACIQPLHSYLHVIHVIILIDFKAYNYSYMCLRHFYQHGAASTCSIGRGSSKVYAFSIQCMTYLGKAQPHHCHHGHRPLQH